MNVLRAVNLLKQDLLEQKQSHGRISIWDKMIRYFNDDRGVPKDRLIHIYGPPDCGKTLIIKNLVYYNDDMSFLYVSKSFDDINKMSSYKNVITLNSNIFEQTIEFLESIEKNSIDIVVIDNINNMLSQEELKSAFTKKLDNGTIFERYIRRISQLAAKKHFVVIVINGVNLINGKSRYGYMIDREAVLSISIEKHKQTNREIIISATSKHNRISNVTKMERFEYLIQPEKGWWN